jgi:hypothetical protein
MLLNGINSDLLRDATEYISNYYVKKMVDKTLLYVSLL